MTAILVLVVLFFAINMLAGALLINARLDVTQGRAFTLTSGSKNIAKSFDEPVKLTLYYSAKLAPGLPGIQSYAQRVRELLQEYVRLSGGKITLTVVDPEPSSEAEDEAAAMGLQGAQVSQNDMFYFGLVGTNSVETREVIPFFSPARDRFLEYDVSRLLYSLANPKKKVVGLISPLQMSGGFTMDPRTRQPMQTPAWQIAEQIRATFELRPLQGSQATIPSDIDVLMIAHPKNLDDATLFAIDQYVLKGGRVIAFVDPFCEADESAAQDPTQRVSEFSKLLDAWGVEVVRGRIAADKELAKLVLTGNQQRPERTSYVGWIGIKGEQLSKEDPTTGQLGTLNFGTAGFIQAKANAAATPAAEGAPAPAPSNKPKAKIAPLASTTARAWQMPVEEVLFQPDPRAMLEHYQAGTSPLTVAARLSGEVESAFPNGIPSTDPASPATPAGLTKSDGSINVILVADADLLSDQQWVRVQNLFGQQMAQKIADNADFVVNALDNLSGSTDLISVRARREESRSFDVVEDMLKKAEENYASEQKALNLKLQETQTKLAELQAKRGTDERSFVLSPEQQAELDRFQQEMLSTRKQLRAVKLNVTKDIESLGTQLKLINIALIPLLVTGIAMLLGAFRSARRRSAVKRT